MLGRSARTWIAIAIVACATPALAVPPPVDPALVDPPSEDPAVAIEDRPAVGVALSGGVSLGAYEAGFLQGLLLPMRDRGVFPRVITGTSAGSINAFVGALEACSPGPTRPTDTFLYKVWVPMGLDKLFVSNDTTAVAALSRKGFAAPLQMIRRRFEEGLDARCDITLGFAVTRARARAIQLGVRGPTIPRMTEHVMVRLRGHGLGKMPTLENTTTRELGRHHMLLPLDGDDSPIFESITSTLLASSGFPLAFPPQKIEHCQVEIPDGAKLPRCTRSLAKPGIFVDGGFFDNRPIGIALSVLQERKGRRPPILAFIDPELQSWPVPAGEQPPRNSALSVVVGMLLDFIATARSSELDRLFGHDTSAMEALRLGRLDYPPASSALGAFFGFVDLELRRFDFYLGLYQARHFRIREMGTSPEDAWNEGDPTDPAWRPLFCLHAIFDRTAGASTLCAGDDLADFRAIARHAIESVAEDCVRAGEARSGSDHAICIELQNGGHPFDVPFVDSNAQVDKDGLPHYRRRDKESDSDWTMRRLAELGFRFHDLGLKPGQGRRAALVLRSKLGDIVDALAAKQGALASQLYRVAGEVGLNMIAYAPPRHLLHVLLGNRLEVGYSWTEPMSVMRWLRLEVAFGLWGLDTLFSDSAAYFGIAPSLGLRFEPLPLSRSLLQPRLGIHGGYLFSTADGFLRDHCDVTKATTCSRPMVEGDVSVALVSLVRLQLSAVWFPATRPGEAQRWSITPGIAVQLPFARVDRR